MIFIREVKVILYGLSVSKMGRYSFHSDTISQQISVQEIFLFCIRFLSAPQYQKTLTHIRLILLIDTNNKQNKNLIIILQKMKSAERYQQSSNNLVVTSNLKTTFDSRWSQIKISKNIKGRSNHVSVFFGDVMYVHGGYDPEQGILSDFYCIDLADENSQFCWKQLPNQVDGHLLKIKSHSAVLYKTMIIIFGGEVNTNQNQNQVYCFDVAHKVWKKIQAKNGSTIPKVDSHCACLVGENMYVYGGYISDKAAYMRNIYCLNLDMMEWRLIYQSSQNSVQPQPRSSSSMVAFKQSLWLFGGTNGIKTISDLWKFDLKLNKWQKIQCSHIPEPRRGHSMILFKDTIFLFGGIQDVTRQKNDVYTYQFEKKTWSKIHTYTNSIYDCSPTLKRSRNEPSNKSIQVFSLQRLSPVKSSHSGDDLMKRIMHENKYKKFLAKKKQLMKEFNQKHQQYKSKRRLSPTTQSMMKSLQSIGNQQDNKNGQRKQIMFDETHRFIVGKKPCARDGQTVAVCKNKMYIFGGDRHLMCFNDLYWFDLEKGLKSLELYRTN